MFVLSLVLLQVEALNPEARVEVEGEALLNLGQDVYTLRHGPIFDLGKRARKADYQAHPAGELVCRPFGLCEPCPADEVSHPWNPLLLGNCCSLSCPINSVMNNKLMPSALNHSANHSEIAAYYTVNPLLTTPHLPSSRAKCQPGKHVGKSSSKKGRISGNLS